MPNPTILVVDDEATLRKLMQFHLRPHGYNVITAGNGVEALEVINSQIPALVIIDVMMPEMNGYELTRQLRKNPRTAHIPIILLTALSNVQEKVEGFQAGADDFLIKPAELPELLMRVEALLRRAAAAQPVAAPLAEARIYMILSANDPNQATNIALNLAGLTQSRQQTIVIELIPAFTNTAFRLGLEAKQTLDALLSINASSIGKPQFDDALITHPSSRIKLLVTAQDGNAPKPLTQEHTRALVNMAQRSNAIVFFVTHPILGDALLPLSAYAYVFVRCALPPEWWRGAGVQSTAGWFWAFVSTAQGREELGWGFEAGRTFFGNGFPVLIWQELSVPLLLAGLVGIAFLNRRVVVLLYGTLAIYLLFAWAYRYGNWFQVVLPAYPLILLGIAGWATRLAEWPATTHRRWVQPALLVLLAVALGWRFSASWPQADSSRRPQDEALARAASLLADDLPQNAALFAEQGDSASLDYLAHIWGLRPDVRVVGSSSARQALDEGRPLLATWGSAATLIAEMGGTHSVSAHNGDWAIIDGAPHTAGAPASATQNTPVSALPVLETYTTTPSPSGAPVTAAAPALDLRLRWLLPAGGWPDGLSLSLRPTLGGAFIADPHGAADAILQVDAATPLHGFVSHAPTGARLDDAYRVPLAAPLPEGADGVAVILYRAVDGGFETLADLRLPLQP